MQEDRLTKQMEATIEKLGDEIGQTNVGTDQRAQAVKDYAELYKARTEQYRVETGTYTDDCIRNRECDIKEEAVKQEKRKLAWLKKDTIIKVSVISGITAITIIAENQGALVSRTLGKLDKLVRL